MRLATADGTIPKDVPLSETNILRSRACPGRNFAEDTLFITAASILASFNVSDAVPLRDGKIRYTSGVIR